MRESGRNASSLHAGLEAAGAQDGDVAIDQAKPLSANERKEPIELRQRVKQVQQECDLLESAAARCAVKSEKTSGTSAIL